MHPDPGRASCILNSPVYIVAIQILVPLRIFFLSLLLPRVFGLFSACPIFCPLTLPWAAIGSISLNVFNRWHLAALAQGWGVGNKDLSLRETLDWSKHATKIVWEQDLYHIRKSHQEHGPLSPQPMLSWGKGDGRQVRKNTIIFSYQNLAASVFIKHFPSCCKILIRFQSSNIIDSAGFCQFNGCFSRGTNSWKSLIYHFCDIISATLFFLNIYQVLISNQFYTHQCIHANSFLHKLRHSFSPQRKFKVLLVTISLSGDVSFSSRSVKSPLGYLIS